MSDFEEPAAKISKVEVAPAETFEDEMDEGQEEWLTEDILTDDDYNPSGDQNQVESNVNTNQYDSTPSIPDADESQEESQDTQTGDKEHLVDNSRQTELPEELGAFLIRKTDGIVVDAVDSKKEESEIDESTKQSDDDGHDTDELLRMLGEDNSKKKEKKVEEKKQLESSEDDDDEYIFEGAKLARLKVAKNAILKKYPTKAVPEESEKDSDASSDEGLTVKRMFGVTKKEVRNVASKSTTKSGINALKTITKKIVTVPKHEGKAPATSTPLPRPLSRKVRPETEVRKVVRLEADDTRKIIKREPEGKRKVVRLESDEFRKVIRGIDDKRRVKLEPDDLPKLIKGDEKQKVKSVRESDEFRKVTRPEYLEKRKVVKLEPEEKRKVVRLESDEKRKVRFGPDKVRKVGRPNSLERRKVVKPEPDEIIDEEEFMEDDHDQFDLDEEFDSDAEGSRQRIMRPEQMDEEMLTDGDSSQSDDESLYDELPSSDSDELHEWFTLDIRSERAGDYLPLLGAKAQQILLAEKQRVASRLSTLKESVTALNDTSSQQAEMLRRATLQIAELDAALKA